jgi:hypothetical protein
MTVGETDGVILGVVIIVGTNDGDNVGDAVGLLARVHPNNGDIITSLDVLVLTAKHFN